MKQVMVALRDSAMVSFANPICVPSVGAAIRSFADGVNGGDNSDIARHPEDFELWVVGEWNAEQGTFGEPEGGRRMLVRGQDVKKES